MKIKFIGAAREVTGSKHLIVTDKGKKLFLTVECFKSKRFGDRCHEPQHYG